jgi:hypothetical protein
MFCTPPHKPGVPIIALEILTLLVDRRVDSGARSGSLLARRHRSAHTLVAAQ